MWGVVFKVEGLGFNKTEPPLIQKPKILTNTILDPDVDVPAPTLPDHFGARSAILLLCFANTSASTLWPSRTVC